MDTPYPDRFSVAFLTLEEDKMKIIDAETFMKETNSEHFASKWEESISGLVRPERYAGLVGLDSYANRKKLPPTRVEVTSCDDESAINAITLMEMIERGDIEVA